MKVKVILALLSVLFSMIGYGQADCDRRDSIPEVYIDSLSQVITFDSVYVYGIDNKFLDASATINGSEQLAEVLDSIFATHLDKETYNSDQYQLLDISFVIHEDDSIHSLFFSHELFWYMEDENGKTQYEEMISSGSEEEIEMAKSIMGYMTYDDINVLKGIILSQKWKVGSCNDVPKKTIISLEINKLLGK